MFGTLYSHSYMTLWHLWKLLRNGQEKNCVLSDCRNGSEEIDILNILTGQNNDHPPDCEYSKQILRYNRGITQKIIVAS